MNFNDRHRLRTDPDRLRAVADSGLVGTPPEERFDQLTRLAAESLGVPASFVSIVGAESDYYKSCVGFPESLEKARELCGDTFCHFTLIAGGVLAVDDARTHPIFSTIPTVQSLGVAAYLGVPIRKDNQTIGAFCVIDSKPRHWTAEDVDTLISLTRVAVDRMEMAEDGVSKTAIESFYDAIAPVCYSLFLRLTRDEEKARRLLEKLMVDAWETHGRDDWRSPAVQAQILVKARREAAAQPREAAGASKGALVDQAAAGSLSALQRRLVNLAYFDGLTITQIAAETSTPTDEVRRELVSAMRALRSANASTNVQP